MKHAAYIAAAICALGLLGCRRDTPPGRAVVIKLATTTSTENSGLLEVLLPAFRRATGIDVHVMPMGTGKALRTARDGNCDVVLVHSPAAEAQFVRAGWGINRRSVMYNDFVILGPVEDQAYVGGAESASGAMKRIAQVGSVFVSRGDKSGTHDKEIALWQVAGITPSGRWYRSVGGGMGQTLTMANEMKAYVLTDRGTFIKFLRMIDLVVVFEGDAALRNPYSVIAINPRKCPSLRHYEEVMKFIEFLTSDEGRTLIAGYEVDGETLFHPAPTEEPGGSS